MLAALNILAATFVSNSANAADEKSKIKRVVLIGVDGAGAFFKDADTPNMDKIFQNGAVSYTVVTSKPTISAQSWGSMLHGVTPEFHQLTNGIVSSRPYPVDSIFPSVFRVIRENRPDANLVSFCHWNPINIGIIEDNIGVLKDTGNDAEVTAKACAYIEKNDPTFLFVHFDEVDGAGHGEGYGSPRHLAQLHTTDGYVQQIYEAIEKRGWLDSTLLIVTADHGGAGRSHGGWTDAEKYIMFAATGPGVEKGTIGEMGVRDTSSVVLYALGLADKQPETWTSRVPSGLFKGVEAKERPVYTIQYAYPHRTHEPTETPKLAEAAPAILGADRVRAYLPFEKTATDALDKVETTTSGNIYYVDGYFGQGARLEDGFVSLPKFEVGKKSFSLAFWLKTGGVNDDPAIVSNTDWRNGVLPGFILSLRANDVKFNFGDGKNRFDAEFSLPIDYRDGWVHIALVVDREASEVKLSYDFGPFASESIPNVLKGASLDTALNLNIGQDGTGKYRVGLDAVVDELLFIDGAINEDDLKKLKALY